MKYHFLETIRTLSDLEIISFNATSIPDMRALTKDVSFDAFSWTDDSILVGTREGLTIKVKWHESGPKVMCSCEHSVGRTYCQHFFEVLIAVRMLLSNSKAKITKSLRSNADILKKQLIGEVDQDSMRLLASASRFVINLYPKVDGRNLNAFFVEITRNGVRKKRGWESGGMPLEFHYLLDSWNPESVEHMLIRLLKESGDYYPIYVHTFAGALQVKHNKAYQLIPKTQFTHTHDGIAVQQMGEYTSKKTDQFINIGQFLIFTFEDCNLGVRLDNQAQENWSVWYKIADGVRPDPNHVFFPVSSHKVLVPFDFFYNTDVFNFQKNQRGFLNNFIFVKNEKEVKPVPRDLNYQVSVDMSSDDENENRKLDSVELRVSSTHHVQRGMHGGFFARAFHELHREVEDRIAKFYKKERIILQSLFHSLFLVNSEAEAHKIITTICTSKLETADKKSIENIQKFFLKLYKLINAVNGHTILCMSDDICIIPCNYIKAWRPFVAAMAIFENYRIHFFSGTLVISQGDFFKKLTEYKAFLLREGIELYIDGKVVRMAQIQTVLDAIRPTTERAIDWFEIKPEILHEGAPISDEEWEQIMQQGMFQRADEFHIVDAQSRDTLDLVSRILRLNPGSKKNTANKVVEIPRLQIFDIIELLQKGVRVSLSQEDKKIVDNLVNFKKIESMPLPNKLQATLREYQKEGYDWLAFLYKHRFGACLADDMGLGKTVQAISLFGGISEGHIARTASKPSPHLVVAPPSLTFNWCNELKKFYPAFRIVEYTGAKRILDFTNTDIVVTSYDIARLDIEKLKETQFDVIVFDEAQAIKNITAKRTSAVRQLQGSFKLCLTGTPLENSVAEYYSIMDVSVPGVLPDVHKIKKSSFDDVAHKNLIQRTRPFILRRTKNEILKELPSKSENDVYFTMTDRQKALYNKVVNEIKRTIERAYREKTAYQARIIALTAILRLRQICVSPRLLDKDAELDSPKIEYLIATLNELVKEKHASLVFSQFIGSLDAIEQELIKAKISYLRIDGSTPMHKRKEIVQLFQEKEEHFVLLLSLKVGGVGLNLTRANHVFHVDPWWNPAVENQASDRAHRLGQQQKVFVYRLLMHHSIEEKMMLLKTHKRALFDAVMEGAAEKTNASISKEDFDFLLG